MNSLWQTILGIERTQGATPTGDSRLELTALPQGATAVAIILAAIAFLFVVWRLYRWERSDLAPAKRALMAGLRALTLLALAAMLVEPVLISSHRETVKSHLALILDDSESMKFSDPYTDQSRAVEIASRMKLESSGGRSSVERLRETPRLESGQERPAGKPRSTGSRPGALLVRPRVGGPARVRRIGAGAHPRTISSPTARSLRWAMRSMACWPAIAASRWPAWSSPATDDPIPAKSHSRAVEAAVRQNIPDLCDRRRGRRRARETSAWPRSRRARSCSCATPCRSAVVVEARGLRDAEATIVLEQRINEGDWEAVGNSAGRPGRGRDPQAHHVSRSRPRSSASRNFAPGSRTPGPELTHGGQRRDRRREGRPAADPRAS